VQIILTLTERAYRGRWGYAFIAPGYIAFLLFMLAPLMIAVGLSFYRASFNISAREFVGLQQYARLFRDRVFLQALKNTVAYTITIVPATIIVSLLLALAINPLGGRTQSVFRAAFYLPSVAGGVVLSVVWLWIFNPTYGLINYGLTLLGIEPVMWLAHTPASFWAVSGVVLTFTIGEPVILFLAGLAAIPQDLIDAARVEGAGETAITFRIRLPLIRPVALFILATQTIKVFQLWEVIYMITNGGPFNTSTSLVYLIYQTAFIGAKYGKASAIGVLLMMIIGVVTVMQMRLWRETDL